MPKLGAREEVLDAGECNNCKAPVYWTKSATGVTLPPLERGKEERVLIEGFARFVQVYRVHRCKKFGW